MQPNVYISKIYVNIRICEQYMWKYTYYEYSLLYLNFVRCTRVQVYKKIMKKWRARSRQFYFCWRRERYHFCYHESIQSSLPSLRRFNIPRKQESAAFGPTVISGNKFNTATGIASLLGKADKLLRNLGNKVSSPNNRAARPQWNRGIANRLNWVSALAFEFPLDWIDKGRVSRAKYS